MNPLLSDHPQLCHVCYATSSPLRQISTYNEGPVTEIAQTEEEQEWWTHEAKERTKKHPTTKEAVVKAPSDDDVVCPGQIGDGASPSAKFPLLNLY